MKPNPQFQQNKKFADNLLQVYRNGNEHLLRLVSEGGSENAEVVKILGVNDGSELVFPVFCVLVTRQTSQLYETVLSKLHMLQPEFQPTNVMADYKEALAMRCDPIWHVTSRSCEMGFP